MYTRLHNITTRGSGTSTSHTSQRWWRRWRARPPDAPSAPARGRCRGLPAGTPPSAFRTRYMLLVKGAGKINYYSARVRILATTLLRLPTSLDAIFSAVFMSCNSVT